MEYAEEGSLNKFVKKKFVKENKFSEELLT